MNKKTILVCCGTGCIAGGSLEVADAIENFIMNSPSDIPNDITVERIKRTGCNGFCENGPIVRIMPDDISYYKVKPKDAEEIIKSIGNEPVQRLLYKDDNGNRIPSQEKNPFYAHQEKRVLSNIGKIDPLDIQDYYNSGGYAALKQALKMSSSEIIDEVIKSGLRGRGGAGFPTGQKWKLAASFDNSPKYVVCNGDEGDPGAFMDRSILEGDPHKVLEGLIIAAIAIGAEEGFLYIRDEYGLARKNVQAAIDDCIKSGIIGNSVMGSGKKLSLSIVRGGGAFVCGESTALMASIEGKVGEPRAKYIRSVEKGLWNQPTVLNNVETLANISDIILNGGDEFKKIGSENNSGTKVFALVGKVKHTGLVEIPMGATLGHIINSIGGGIIGNRAFKAVQTGGPSGGCIPGSMLDIPLDFDSLTSYGGMMGSGGMIVMDDRSCMVEVARYYTNFLAEESCGKCTVCREGLRQMKTILAGICEGEGKPEDIKLLEEIGETMKDASLCSLGKTAPNPVLTTIKYFREEYEAHINQKICPAGVCKNLTSFVIDSSKCTGCSACKRACPIGAITGEIKEAHDINKDICQSCGACREVCKFDAIISEGRA